MAEPKRIGTVVLIGGAEEKGPNADVLGRFVEALDGRKLVVMTCATEDPQGAWERYRKTFRELGVQDIAHVDVRDRVMARRQDERAT
jgi:cyanophycinase